MIYLIIYLLGFCATIAIMVLLVDKDVIEGGEGIILSAAIWPVTLTIIFFIIIFKQIL